MDMSIPQPDVEPHIPAGFQREVWQRIAGQQAAHEGVFLPSFVRWISAYFARPQHAAAVVAVMLTSGLGLAHVQAQDSNSKNWKALEARYADSINPLAMAD
jgi:hypothetical protein